MDLLNRTFFDDNSTDSLIEFSEKLTKVFIKSRTQESVDYLLGRGLSQKDIDKFEWGTVPKMSLKNYPQFTELFKDSKIIDEDLNFVCPGSAVYPIRHAEGYVTGWQAKNPKTGKYYTMSIHGTMPNVYGLDKIGPEKVPFGLITEGYFDYYAVQRCLPLNLPVVSTITANVRENTLKYLSRFFTRLVFLYDLGVWETPLGQTVKKRLDEFNIRHTIIDFPNITGVKDWGEVYEQHGEKKTSALLVKMVPDITTALEKV
jgi:hypothetical protein